MVTAGDVVFAVPSAIFATLTNVRMFVRYVGIIINSLPFLSPEWNSKISQLSMLLECKDFQDAQNTNEK